MGYLILISGWALYFFVHSFLAAEDVKKLVLIRIPSIGRSYRLIYSLISTIGLLGLGYYQLLLKSPFLFLPLAAFKMGGALLAIVGLAIIGISFRYYSAKAFLGLSQSQTEMHFVRDGILNKVRHPIYSGTILIVIGFFLIHPTEAMAIVSICVFVYLPIGIYFEERKLIRQFGSVYHTYRKEVPAIIPHFM